MPHPHARIYEFAPFRLEVGRRLLLRDAQPVKLTAKVFDLLTALVEGRGRVVAKDELMQAVWGETCVTGGNLPQAVLVLRRALNDAVEPHRFVGTVPGKGYYFAAQVTEPGFSAAEVNPAARANPAMTNGAPPAARDYGGRRNWHAYQLCLHRRELMEDRGEDGRRGGRWNWAARWRRRRPRGAACITGWGCNWGLPGGLTRRWRRWSGHGS